MVLKKSEGHLYFSRQNNIVFEHFDNGDVLPVLKLLIKFIDVNRLNEQSEAYTNRFCAMRPDLFEIEEKKEAQQQLTLF